MTTIIDERTARTPREAQLKFVNGLQAGSSRPIFHFPFSICHLALKRISQWQASNDKWKMENGKWKMRTACYLRFKSVLRTATHIAARSSDQLWLRGRRG